MIKTLCRLTPKLLFDWKVCGFIRVTRSCALCKNQSAQMGPQLWIPYRLNSTSKKNYSADELMVFNQKATEAFKEGDYGEAIHLWELISDSENHSKDSVAVIGCLYNLASVYGKVGKHARKIELLEKNRQVVERMYSTAHLQYAMALSHLACAEEEVGNYAAMRRHLEAALAVQETCLNPTNVKLARVLLLLANAHERLGESAAQLHVAARVVEILQRHYGAAHIQTTSALMILGRAYGANNQPEKHLKLVQQAFEIHEIRFGSGNPQLAQSLLELAKAHAANGDYAKQKELLDKALDVQKRAVGEQPTYLVETYLSLGDAYAKLGEVGSMVHYYNEALKMAQCEDGCSPVEIGRAAIKAALGNLQVKNLKNARKLATEAGKLLTMVSSNHPLAKDLAEIDKKLTESEENERKS
ncbi:unnamed protein product [Phytomonas sp. Hart1]|nr:unnamed protein product [Phytomonas sp. Hart1]|eukprot:CCW66452.1 unnamed protein product [Phytomonas sp. isolate Hart1]